MQRRDFLGRMVGTWLAASSLGRASNAGETGFEARARTYLRSILPSRQRIEDFITGEYGPREARPGDVVQYPAPLYNGHHTPRGNFFTASALKDRVVQRLNPKPLPYR